MSGIVFLLTIQLRPLSPRLLPCTSSIGPLEKPSHVPLSGFPLRMERLPGSVCRQRHRPVTMLNLNNRKNYRCSAKKRRPQAFSVPQRRLKRACMGTPNLPQVTIFSIMTNTMRHPLVARRVGDPGPAKAESPILFCSPALETSDPGPAKAEPLALFYFLIYQAILLLVILDIKTF